jgi:hypothetical protein
MAQALVWLTIVVESVLPETVPAMSDPSSNWCRWINRPEVATVYTIGRRTGAIVSTRGPSVRRNAHQAPKPSFRRTGTIQSKWRFETITEGIYRMHGINAPGESTTSAFRSPCSASSLRI